MQKLPEKESYIKFLGTGTSTGVPQLGCDCAVCHSSDPHDRRMRCSSIVSIGGTRILVDCGPDFYFQMLHESFRPFDAVLITHEHYDHVGGLDDLRPFTRNNSLNIYCNELTAKHLLQRLPYCFNPPEVKGIPHFRLNVVAPHETFYVGGVPVTPLRIMHGRMEILGYRIDDLVYITDMLTCQPEEMDYIKGAKLLVVNALRKKPHPTHQTLSEAIRFAYSTGISEVYFIHESHDIGFHAEVDKSLPKGMHLAYDGLTVKF